MSRVDPWRSDSPAAWRVAGERPKAAGLGTGWAWRWSARAFGLLAIAQIVLGGRLLVQMLGLSGPVADLFYQGGGYLQRPFVAASSVEFVRARGIFEPETIVAIMGYAALALAVPLMGVLVAVLTWDWIGAARRTGAFVTEAGFRTYGVVADVSSWLMGVSRPSRRFAGRQSVAAARILGRESSAAFRMGRRWFFRGAVPWLGARAKSSYRRGSQEGKRLGSRVGSSIGEIRQRLADDHGQWSTPVAGSTTDRLRGASADRAKDRDAGASREAAADSRGGKRRGKGAYVPQAYGERSEQRDPAA